MATQVEFLLLESSSQSLGCALDSLTELYLQHQGVLVLVAKRLQLEQLDEILWHKSAEQFIPYSTDDECYANSSAVLITDVQPPRLRFNSLVNLSEQPISEPGKFRSIKEIVEFDETSKQLARERYTHYRQLGFDISHRAINLVTV